MAIPDRPSTPPLVGFDNGVEEKWRLGQKKAKAEEAYNNALKGPTQLAFHYAAGLCESLGVKEFAIKCYTSATNAFYTDRNRNLTIFIQDSFNLGRLFVQSQQWREAGIVYAKALNAHYLPHLNSSDKLLCASMQKNFQMACFNLASANGQILAAKNCRN